MLHNEWTLHGKLHGGAFRVLSASGVLSSGQSRNAGTPWESVTLVPEVPQPIEGKNDRRINPAALTLRGTRARGEARPALRYYRYVWKSGPPKRQFSHVSKVWAAKRPTSSRVTDTTPSFKTPYPILAVTFKT